MGLIAINYQYMIKKFPDTGGSFTYALREFGPDHGFLCSWFLWLVYLSIFWANVTALPILVKFLFGPILQVGFHYTVYDYPVYLGEILFTLGILSFVGLVAVFFPRLTVVINCVCALITFLAVIVIFSQVFAYSGTACLDPPFFEDARASWHQVFNILALAPWAFAGFEAISHMDKGENFPLKPSFQAEYICRILQKLKALN